jgi:hypothetical protein
MGKKAIIVGEPHLAPTCRYGAAWSDMARAKRALRFASQEGKAFLRCKASAEGPDRSYIQPSGRLHRRWPSVLHDEPPDRPLLRPSKSIFEDMLRIMRRGVCLSP